MPELEGCKSRTLFLVWEELKFFFITSCSCSGNHLLLLSVSSSFPSKVQQCLQFGEFLLVPETFFHLVGKEIGPRGRLGVGLRSLGKTS